jgi:hypothetical protein
VVNAEVHACSPIFMATHYLLYRSLLSVSLQAGLGQDIWHRVHELCVSFQRSIPNVSLHVVCNY